MSGPGDDPRALEALEALRGEPGEPGPDGLLGGDGLVARVATSVRGVIGARDPFTAVVVVVAVLAAVVVGAGAVWVARSGRADTGTGAVPWSGTTVLGAPAEVEASPTTAPGILVHAAGAVGAPGVYRLPAGARVGDLLAAAGGARPDADVDRLNLAAPLADGQRLLVPRVGEPSVAPVVPEGGSGATDAAPAGTGTKGPVALNTAGEEELQTLPGIGPATAAAIVEHRRRNGPFATVDDLLDVRGIGPAKLEALRDLVVVG